MRTDWLNVSVLSTIFGNPALLLFQIWYLANRIFRSLFPSTKGAVTRFNPYGFLQHVSACLSPWRTYLMHVRGSMNVGRAKEELSKRIQNCCASLRRSRNKRYIGSWLKSLTSFKRRATTRNNTEQHATGCANGPNLSHPTMLEVIGQICCVLFHRA